MTGRVVAAKPLHQQNESTADLIGLPKIAQRSFDIKDKVMQQTTGSQDIKEEDPEMIMTPTLDQHNSQQL